MMTRMLDSLILGRQARRAALGAAVFVCAFGLPSVAQGGDDAVVGRAWARGISLSSADGQSTRITQVGPADDGRPGPTRRGARADCNGNGIDDLTDIFMGTSEDCNSNAVPDECEIFALPIEYSYDDGTAEYGLRSTGTHLAWLNNFTVTGGAGMIDAADVMFVNVPDGAPAMVYLWSDPNGDGNPTDAQVLAAVPTDTLNSPGAVSRVNLPDTYVGGTGTSFFVGVIIAYPTEDSYPCPLDASAPITFGVGWIIGRDGAIDPNDLSAGAIEFALIEDAISVPTNIIIRAIGLSPANDCNLNSVPDDCDIADGTSADVDGNGVPDECEDCNGNGVPDGLDISGGASLDCQPDGTPDECQTAGNDCNTDGVPDDCQLEGNDCNENGSPDECDIAAGTSQDINTNGLPDECEDCNGNGLPDDIDVSGGTSPDCQPDGIPDECQWGEPDYVTYKWDDGGYEGTLGLGQPGETVWLNHFTVKAGAETVAYVDIVYTGSLGEGHPVTIYLWADPNGDGSPADAQVLASAETEVVNGGSSVFNAVYLGDTYVGEVGTSFFAGASIVDESGSRYPITRDTTDPQGESWLAASLLPDLIDPNNLGGSQYFGRLNDFGFAANTMIRARGFDVYPFDCNQNEVPDGCDLAAGTSQDLDASGVPDECEDCDGNAIPDGCDLTCDGLCSGIPGCGLASDCDSNGTPDECDVAAGDDCNGNAVPDTCDVPPLGTYSLDCNWNLVPDECDLGGNDCNNDLIPDDCQYGGIPVPQYFWDDGTAENTIGLSNGGDLAWLNRFVTEENGESIKAVSIAYGAVEAGTPVLVGVWNDPNNDGNPADAHLLSHVDTVVVNPGSNTFNYVGIPEIYIGAPGTKFFVGALISHAAGSLPAPIDMDSYANASWLAGSSAGVDPNNLDGAGLFGRTGDFGFEGNWLVRAVAAGTLPTNDCNGNLYLDECELAAGDPSDCCVAGDAPGCSDATCEAAVCAVDAICCSTVWDAVCAGHAEDLCGDLCAPSAVPAAEDCNENGTIDECDVPPLGDFSLDCNRNLKPDECEVAAGKDCDGNGIPDDCQPEDDCDENGVVDSCELDFTSNGLVGQYWRTAGNGNFSQRLAVRVDEVIEFDWGGGQPHPDVPADQFAVRWTGLLLTTPVSGEYTFHAKADDGVRLWVGTEQLIDEWHSSSSVEYYGKIQLLGNAVYQIRMDYYEGGGGAKVYLKWSPPGGTKETVPTEALLPMVDCDGNGLVDRCEIDDEAVPEYKLDDGTAENTIGIVSGGSIAYLNHFEVQPNGEKLAGVDIAYGSVAEGTPLTVYLWSDPNNDGNPADGQVLVAVATTVANPNSDTLNFVPMAETYVGAPGTSFYVGAIIQHPSGSLPAPLDQSSNANESWLAGSGSIIDPNGLGAAPLFGRPGDFGFPGNWLVRAVALAEPPANDVNLNGILDECEDCNKNGVVDDEDVSGGFSEDCNANGLPDECEVAGGGLADCNGNAVPDGCELESNDCNGNGIHDSCEAITTGLVGAYYGNPYFFGTPLTRIDRTIDFDWGDGSPAVGIPTNNFTVRWTGVLLTRAAGTYQFRADRDDGFRLYIDGRVVFDGNSGSMDLPENTPVHVRGEFWENSGGARVTLFWTPPGEAESVIPTEAFRPMFDGNGNGIADVCEFGDCNANGMPDNLDIVAGRAPDCDLNGVPDECQGNCDCDGNGILESCEAGDVGGLVGQYWSSSGGSGHFSSRVLVRVDPVVDFNWGGASPDTLVPNDNFTVRWTGTVTTLSAAGTYTFYTHTDDGVRLWVDGQLIIDHWVDQAPREWSGSLSLAADTSYLITMEYYEGGGGAEATLMWEPPGGVKEVIPTEALSPMADADGDNVPDVCAALDCNDNGVADAQDLVLGTSLDCNANCTPDECDVAPPPFDYGRAHWRFEEASGGTVLDSGPNGLNGTTNGLPVRTTDVAANPVPQSGLANNRSLDLNWQSPSNGGFFTVPDIGGQLTLGNHDFTIEAWVRLDHVSNTDSNDERQYLCQKKPLPSQDGQVDYAMLVQRGNNSVPSPNYGKTSGFSGRELQLVFGQGSSTLVWGVTSNLEINDYDWHFVSVAVDTTKNMVRFGIDDQFEIVPFNDNARVTNSGPLRVGSHQNGEGVDNFFLRGTIDELRITASALAAEDLLNHTPSAAYSADCNENLVPDECDVASGTSPDINGNGIPDECDCMQPASPAAEPTVTDGGSGTRIRYISFAGGTPGERQALRVTLTASIGFPGAVGSRWWVGQPQQVSESSGSDDPTPLPTFWTAELQCDPYFTDWSAYASLHVGSRSIVPHATYEIQVVSEDCEEREDSYSLPLSVTVSHWGDITGDCSTTPCSAPDGRTDFTDIAAVVDKFKNLPGAVAKSRADLAPETPDRIVDFVDISWVVDAFRGLPYPFGAPSACP